MTAAERVKSVFSPPAESSEHDTGLRFTDILFGFVISQVFLRLQNWSELSSFTRWQLICSSALVLGSWIGFRRSLNRSQYELKFFNIPLFRFLLDQAMVILYFRVATLTPLDPEKAVDPTTVARDTIKALAIVFFLYLIWDLAGLLMGRSKKYEGSSFDLKGLAITVLGMALAAAFLCHVNSGHFNTSLAMALATGLLLGYRWVKEIRSTWKKATEETRGRPAEPPGTAQA